MQPSSNALSDGDHQHLMTLLSGLPEVSLPDCATYKTYRSILLTALPIIGHIPIYGSKIAAAISFLMNLADGVCQVPAGLEASAQPGKIVIEKSGVNELRVTFPAGSTIGASSISEADLYFALSRDLLKQPASPNAANCVGVLGPICIID